MLDLWHSAKLSPVRCMSGLCAAASALLEQELLPPSCAAIVLPGRRASIHLCCNGRVCVDGAIMLHPSKEPSTRVGLVSSSQPAEPMSSNGVTG